MYLKSLWIDSTRNKCDFVGADEMSKKIRRSEKEMWNQMDFLVGY